MHRKLGSDHSVPRRMYIPWFPTSPSPRGQSGLTPVCPVDALFDV
jgi:hypothetical protein